MSEPKNADGFLGALRPEIHPELRAVALAERQAGVVHRRQLRAIGIGDDRVKRWLAAGRLHRVHRGVFALGHPVLSMDGRCWAAVLACGTGSLIAARSAAALWDLAPHPTSEIDLVSDRAGVRSPAGLCVRRSTRLRAVERADVRGIPVTSVARTLADLAAVVSRRRLERAMEQADRLQRLDVGLLLASVRHRPGASAVRAVLEAWAPAPTRSVLEDRLLALVEGSGLPRPAINALVGPYECDQVWERERLIVEADGREFHGTRAAMERDRRKDAYLVRRGWRVVRFTWGQVTGTPAEVLATIRAALNNADGFPGG